MSAAKLVCALAVALPTLVGSAGDTAAKEQRAYVRAVPDRSTFEAYSRKMRTDRFTKFIIDVKTDDIYFIDVNLFKLHADFVLGVLLDQEWSAENIRRYNKNYEREKPSFILGYITEHLEADTFTFSFWEGDKIDAAGVARVHKKLRDTFFVKSLAFRPDSPAQLQVAGRVARRGIKTITNDKIYKTAQFQPFNAGESVGVLRIVARGTPYASLTFDRHDIVILQEAYPDIPPVAGIMSTVFSTPLAHVNLRATAWGIPNAGFVDAYERYAELDGKHVYYQVTDEGHVLREATAAEIQRLKERIKNRETVDIPPADLRTANMAMLTRIRASQSRTYGAKTANLGEIASAAPSEVHVPPGFGLPFFYYVRHMRQHGLDARLARLLADERWDTDKKWRRRALESLQSAIREAPIDSAVLDAVYKRVRLELGGQGVFVRSSTNAEDLPGFNGAGLYETVPNVRGKKALGEAVKTVWASLWSHRAVAERELFGIDHSQVYAAVMLQVGVDATAAGVLVTDNLYNPEESDAFTVNANWGLGIRTVEGTRVPEQIVFDTSNDGTKIISRSDEPYMLVFDKDGGIREIPNPHQGVILTEERAKRLASAVMAFQDLFARHEILDIEWLFEGEKVWIVQCRPYVRAGRR